MDKSLILSTIDKSAAKTASDKYLLSSRNENNRNKNPVEEKIKKKIVDHESQTEDDDGKE